MHMRAGEASGRNMGARKNDIGKETGEDIMAEFTYEIIETYGVLKTTQAGWTTEVNKISWNGKEPKIDIRAWSPDHQKMAKGITLGQEETKKLREILGGMQL